MRYTCSQRKQKHLTIAERRLIEKWTKEGKSNRQIANLLGKAPQTINNDIKRGTVLQQVRNGKFDKHYSADYAQQAYTKARQNSSLKAKIEKATKEKIVHYMRQKYSPEMMVKAKGLQAAISTIYYWLHHGYLGLTKADMLYPRHSRAAKKTASPNFRPAGKSIEERPEVINFRLANSYYEIDTVILTQTKNHYLLVLTDRKSRHQLIRRIPNKSATAVNEALKKLLDSYDIKSLTADNGPEFTSLSELEGFQVYYSHAYSSYERGTNEHFNALLREFIPKGQSLKVITAEDLAEATSAINQRPRRLLGYQSAKTLLWLAQAT